MDEARFYDETSFLTCTYSDESLPPRSTLDLDAYTRFLKRLRRHLAPKRVRFFGCGEYGDRTGRPHYHFILLGHAFTDDRRKHGGQLYISDTLDKIWGLGNCTIGDVTHDSAGYVARYALKKINGPDAAKHYGDRRPEFMTCSNGIGKRYFELYRSDLYPDDFQVYKGRKMRVPRYYDKQLPEHELQAYKAKRLERAEEHTANNTSDRLRVRETVAKARVGVYLIRDQQ